MMCSQGCLVANLEREGVKVGYHGVDVSKGTKQTSYGGWELDIRGEYYSHGCGRCPLRVEDAWMVGMMRELCIKRPSSANI